MEFEYYQFVEFYSARAGKSFVSSKEWEIDGTGQLNAIGGDCLGYDEWRREIDEGVPRDNRSISMRLLHAFNFLHLDWYHLVPVMNKDGTPMKFKHGDKAGEQVYDRLQCEGRRCDHCKEGHEKVFGKKVHWSVGSGHLGDLVGIMEEVRKDCASCGGRGSLEPVSYECSKCGEVFVDMENTKMSDEEIYDFSAQSIKCKGCGNEDYPLEQFECSECQDPMPTSIFDVDLEIKRTGEGTNSTIQVPRWTRTDLTEELEAVAGEPYTFKDIFSPDPFDIQAKLLKVRNTYGKGGGKADEHAEDYDKEADYSE